MAPTPVVIGFGCYCSSPPRPLLLFHLLLLLPFRCLLLHHLRFLPRLLLLLLLLQLLFGCYRSSSSSRFPPTLLLLLLLLVLLLFLLLLLLFLLLPPSFCFSSSLVHKGDWRWMLCRLLNVFSALQTTRLFGWFPKNRRDVKSWREAKKFFNFGVIEIQPDGDLTAQVRARGEPCGLWVPWSDVQRSADLHEDDSETLISMMDEDLKLRLLLPCALPFAPKVRDAEGRALNTLRLKAQSGARRSPSPQSKPKAPLKCNAPKYTYASKHGGAGGELQANAAASAAAAGEAARPNCSDQQHWSVRGNTSCSQDAALGASKGARKRRAILYTNKTVTEMCSSRNLCLFIKGSRKWHRDFCSDLLTRHLCLMVVAEASGHPAPPDTTDCSH